jgi:uncharacterized protein YfaQ (DUF2300 family)
MGHFALLVRLKLVAGSDSKPQAWLIEQILPSLPSRAGLGSVHLVKSSLTASMTVEQRIRGADSGGDWALLATGYELAAVAALEDAELGAAALQAHGISTMSSVLCQAAYSLTADEVLNDRQASVPGAT